MLLNDQPVYYEVGGEGAPLVFIHGIGGGNSGYQWVKNAAAFTRNHRVYVLDLPGFGRSIPRPQNYTADLYVKTLTAFLKEVVQQEADVVASSLGAAYSIKIAHNDPELVQSLTLVSPTGIEKLVNPPNADFYNSLVGSPLGDVIAGFLRGRFSVSFFLKQQVYLDQSLVTTELKKIYQNNLKDPNAAYPVFSFISDYSSLNIAKEWAALKQPAMMVWGSDDVNTPVSGAQKFLDLRPEVKLQVLTARAIPNDERSAEFNGLLQGFLQGP
ncbi:alpha/beta hydrolase [Deinococcus roseus]|uniref:Alpha/beta hydrolase n=1 Tax=Deinococcus roseus TaxID=392414 RepID=A0ABQ2DBS3_9DEIO|nr:alpha/beta hydrolase [Deinococcus roseus]